MLEYELIFFIFEECLFLFGFFLGVIGILYFGSMVIIIFVVIMYLMVFYMKFSIFFLSVSCLCFLGSIYFFFVSGVSYNLFILLVFIVYFFFELLVDIYFFRLSFLEIWKKFIF